MACSSSCARRRARSASRSPAVATSTMGGHPTSTHARRANLVSSILMKMRTLNHLSLVVSDIDRSASFYQTLFGMERQWQEGDFVFLSCGDADVALVKGKPLIHRRFHFGFR